jgi:hypothetical protein
LSRSKGTKPRRKAAQKGSPHRVSNSVSKLVRGAVTVLVEAGKLAREMVAIPLALWMTVAEAAGAVVLAGWRLIRPLIVRAWRLLASAERIAERRLTPKWAVAAVSVAVLVALAASQWVDYREISVGNFAYDGGVENIAPPPDVATDRAGNAHSWVMVPIAGLGLVLVVAALAGRWRAGRLLAALGVVVIAIGLLVDLPKGLDEGSAAIVYEGAKASLLEGFWLELACGAAMVACGLLLGGYARPSEARRPARDRQRPRSPARIWKRLRVGRPAAGSSA